MQDLIINTVSANHELQSYLPLLDFDGVLVMLGLTTNSHKLDVIPMVFTRKSVAGSCIGGIRETQEVIDFCARHGIVPDIEVVTDDRIPEIYDRLSGKNDSITRYVLDIVKSADA